MEQVNDEMWMLDLVSCPVFCVRENVIIKVNDAARPYMLEAGQKVLPLLATGQEEYAAFQGGSLCLTLTLAGQNHSATVTREKDFDVFSLEQSASSQVLQAMDLVARELRSPLSQLMAGISRLECQLQDSSALAPVNQGIYQVLRIVNNISDTNRFSAVENCRMQILNICGIVDEAFAAAAAVLEKAGYTLRYEGFPESVYCQTDKEILARGIQSILSNAVKFTPKGGMIDAVLTKRGSKLYLCVQDSGCGIPQEAKANLFHRYRRQPGVEEGRCGLGMGMSLISAAAAAHGGTVLVDHPGDAGTRITLSLAIRSSEVSQLRSTTVQVDYTGGYDPLLVELSESLPPSFYQREM